MVERRICCIAFMFGELEIMKMGCELSSWMLFISTECQRSRHRVAHVTYADLGVRGDWSALA